MRTERERMRDGLGPSFDIVPSVAPYLLLDAGSPRDAAQLIETCRAADIAVYDARDVAGLDSHVRVVVDRPGQNDVFLEQFS